MFDIKTITQNKLEYNKKEYDELKTIYEQNKDIFSKDANAYLKDKMNSYLKNIKYYTDILKLIESEDNQLWSVEFVEKSLIRFVG